MAKVYRFSKEKLLSNPLAVEFEWEKHAAETTNWIERCDGKEVEFETGYSTVGFCEGQFLVKLEWCVVEERRASLREWLFGRKRKET